jgi:phosphomevalonate kinase
LTTWAAPGKAVIWGEYAVLAGAPAMVMAVNRYATTSIAPRADGWHIQSRGFPGAEMLTAADLENGVRHLEPTAADLIRAVVAALESPDLPAGAEVVMDTSTFHQGGAKLGIGSSAAICTAACAALCDHLQMPFTRDAALAAHRNLQGSSGSGLDVAAACAGGTIRFESGRVSETAWPAELTFSFIWTGHSATTTRHIARFRSWQESGQTQPLAALCAASEALFDRLTLDGLRDYAIRLEEMDAAAGLGIYGEAHRRLSELANRAQVVYKPCGAGGGDIGIAVSDDVTTLTGFLTSTAREKFTVIDLEIATDGVHRIRE